MEAQTCLECGSKIRGRTDKKFCNDQCRNSYHNRMKSEINALVRRINKSLRHNRYVLSRMIPESKGKTTVPKTKLVNAGFNFTYHTHIYTSKNGHTYYFCYEYGYRPLEKEVYMLVKWKE